MKTSRFDFIKKKALILIIVLLTCEKTWSFEMDLTLFYRPTCPFCVKVLKVIKEEHIDVTLKNISENQEYLSELISVGGKKQVPCLFINGKPMYESNDIIYWLKEHKDK